jgi:SAM-dependent methyltransferase
MALDIVDLRSFYAGPLGSLAQRVIAQAVRQRWESVRDCAVLGVGYALPFIEQFRQDQPDRILAFMPATMGVSAWPAGRLSAAALVDLDDLPLRDQTVDRVLLLHALEMAHDPAGVLEEIWRVLAPGGRLVAVVPNRRGFWARTDNNPFAQGQPFSRRQLTALMRQALFTPVHWGETLYAPPVARRIVMKMAKGFEAVGGPLSLPFAGVHVIEATKQVFRPVPLRKSARISPSLQPALAGNGMGLVGSQSICVKSDGIV